MCFNKLFAIGLCVLAMKATAKLCCPISHQMAQLPDHIQTRPKSKPVSKH